MIPGFAEHRVKQQRLLLVICSLGTRFSITQLRLNLFPFSSLPALLLVYLNSSNIANEHWKGEAWDSSLWREIGIVHLRWDGIMHADWPFGGRGFFSYWISVDCLPLSRFSAYMQSAGHLQQVA
jgi:hypothetical protein